MHHKEKRDEKIKGDSSSFGVPPFHEISVALFEMIPDKKRNYMRVNQLIYRFCDRAEGGPSYLAVIVLVVHRDTGMAGIPFSGDLGLVVVVHPWERIYRLTFRDHTVELSAFWHVIRRISRRRARFSYLPTFWLPFASLDRSSSGCPPPRNRQRESLAESASPTTVGTKSRDGRCLKTNVYQRVGRHPDSFRIL